MDQLALEELILSGIVGKLEYTFILLSRAAGNFAHYITSKELKFIFVLTVESFQKYSGLMTEQYLVDALISKGASEEDVLKYRYVLKQLRRSVPEEQDFRLAVDKLTDNFVSRCLIDSMLQTQELLQRDRNGVAAFDVLEKNMMILKNQIMQKDISEFSTRAMTDEVRLYDDMKANPERYRGIKIGIDKLDEITGGFRKGELVVAMGATKVGKSIFLLNAQYNTMINGYDSLLFTIEMPKEQYRKRLASRVTELPYMKIKNVHLTAEEEAKLFRDLDAFEKRVAGHSLVVDVPKDCTAKTIEAKVRAVAKNHKVDVIFIDYLLLMSPSIPHSKLSREEKITQIALELKQMARSLNIPVITATQINAKAEERDRKHKHVDEVYDWIDAGQAKSIVSHSDWVLSLKREPDTNLLHLGITAGRDGAMEEVLHLVADYGKMAIYNFVPSPVGVAAKALDAASGQGTF